MILMRFSVYSPEYMQNKSNTDKKKTTCHTKLHIVIDFKINNNDYKVKSTPVSTPELRFTK